MRKLRFVRVESFKHREGDLGREILSGPELKRESLRGEKALRESGPRPDLIHPGARRGTAFLAG